MKYNFAASALVAAGLALAPVTQASAHGYYYCGVLCGLGAFVGAVVTAPLVIATAPFVALAPRGPAYYAPPPPRPYYAPPPAYYARPRGYYAAPPGYYAPPRGYYGAPPGY